MNILNVHLRFEENNTPESPLHPISHHCCDEIQRATHRSSGKAVLVSRIPFNTVESTSGAKRLRALLAAHEQELLELEHIYVKRKPGEQ